MEAGAAVALALGSQAQLPEVFCGLGCHVCLEFDDHAPQGRALAVATQFDVEVDERVGGVGRPQRWGVINRCLSQCLDVFGLALACAHCDAMLDDVRVGNDVGTRCGNLMSQWAAIALLFIPWLILILARATAIGETRSHLHAR